MKILLNMHTVQKQFADAIKSGHFVSLTSSATDDITP